MRNREPSDIYDRVEAQETGVTKAWGVLMGLGMMMTAAGTAQAQGQPQAHHWAIVVHGGAGVIERSKLGPEGDTAYRVGLTQALEAGTAVLDKGGSALDAVEAAIHVLEDDPHFNAGRGAVFQRRRQK